MSHFTYSHLTRDDLIWLAGLLEGEGTFDTHKQRYPRIRVGMTDRDVVGRAATLMGSSIRMTLSAQGHKPMFHSELSGARAADLMRLLIPHMGSRRSSKIGQILGDYAAYGASSRDSFPGPVLTRPPGFIPAGQLA